MLRRFVHSAFLFTSLYCVFAAVSEASRTAGTVSCGITPVPNWVKTVAPPEHIGSESESAGVIYVLVDRQENVERGAFYYHDIRKVTSENGIQNEASVSTSFDPTFQKLFFHKIEVTRDGLRVNRLDRSRIKLFPREKEPDRALYDDSYSAEIVLDDLRVGDVIESAWTIEGKNPLLPQKYFTNYSMQWTMPIARNVLRLIYPSNRTLVFQARNGAKAPTVVTTNGVTEAWYQADNILGRKVEDDAPDDYSPRQRLEISEFKDWAEVARWIKPLFEIPPPHSPEFQAEVAKLRAIANPEQRVVAALEFVQEQIRGISIGLSIGSRRLTPPDEVMRRRFANDKDKAVLFLALLHALNIDATPALVSGFYRATVTEFLPSPDVFNHLIVRVRLEQGTYWLDPWRSPQRGPLSQIYIARAGFALPLDPAITNFVAFEPPKDSFPVKKVIENYRIPAPENDADLEVITEYHGLAADQTRSSFQESTRDEIQKTYLEYYARNFPEVRVQKPLWYEELPGQNACRVTESYVIPKIWQLSDDKNRYLISLHPGDINSAIGSTISAQRDDPLSRNYPTTVIEQMNVEMFEDWPIETKTEITATDFFKVRDEPSVNASHLEFNYSYEALTDRVEVNQISKYNDAVTKVKDSLGYNLRYSTPEQLKKNKRHNSFNWAVGAAALCFFGMASFLAFRYFRDTRLTNSIPPPIDAPADLNGIGGWLILLAIIQILRPLSYIKTGIDLYQTMFNTHSWRSLTDPIESAYDSWWAPTLLFELFFNIISLVFCALLIFLFFAKRFTWPRCFAAFLIFSIAGSILDILLVHHIPAATEPIWHSIPEVVGALLGAAIWIPYIFLSKRVKATFRY
jgi:transglutaminase-like putative cysteine protease